MKGVLAGGEQLALVVEYNKCYNIVVGRQGLEYFVDSMQAVAFL